MAGDLVHISLLNSALRIKNKCSFVGEGVNSFIPAGASGKRCTAYFSPSVPCVVNIKKRLYLDVLVGCLKTGPARPECNLSSCRFWVSLISGMEYVMEWWNGKWNGTVNVHNYS